MWSLSPKLNFRPAPSRNWIVFGLAVTVGWRLCQFLARLRHKRRLHAAIRDQNTERQKAEADVRARLDDSSYEEKKRRQQIQALSFPELVKALQAGEYTAVESTLAWQEKALIAHQNTNAVTMFVTEAEQWAKELDEAAKDPNYKKPPLFGVPFSVKESTTLKGHFSTRGYAQTLLGERADSDAVLVQCLRQLGALPIALTNVPQSLLSYSCSNPIYGTTTNPYNYKRTCGGSSGGEAALIASKGILFGIGGDVGGSIRMPAHFCGIVGIKPCAQRLSKVGGQGSIPGRPMICAALGPMSPDVDTTVTVMRLLLSSGPNLMYDLDPYTAPLPFNDDLYESKMPMTIGYYEDDGFFQATTACRRAVQLSKEALEKAGHRLVLWQPPNFAQGMALFTAAVTVDGGKYLLNMLDNDIIDENYGKFAWMLRVPLRWRRLLSHLLGLHRLSNVSSRMPRNVSDMRQVYAEIEVHRKAFVKSWKEAGLDCVICPAQVTPALPHEMPPQIMGTVSYTAIYNMYDCPAGVVPVTKVTQEDQLAMKSYPTRDRWDRLVQKCNVSDTVGLPVAVQCVALPFREEITLRLMKEIETLVAN